MCFTTSRLTLYPTVQKHILLTVFTSVELYFAFFSFCFEKTTRNLCDALYNQTTSRTTLVFLNLSNLTQSELLSKRLVDFVPLAKSQFQSAWTCIQLWFTDTNVFLGRRRQFRRQKFALFVPFFCADSGCKSIRMFL